VADDLVRQEGRSICDRWLVELTAGSHVRYWRGCDAPNTLLAMTLDDVVERFDGDRLSLTDVVEWYSRGDEGSTTVAGSTADSALCHTHNTSTITAGVTAHRNKSHFAGADLRWASASPQIHLLPFPRYKS